MLTQSTRLYAVKVRNFKAFQRGHFIDEPTNGLDPVGIHEIRMKKACKISLFFEHWIITKLRFFLFFPYLGKVCGTILKSIITIQGYLCENLYRRK